MPAQGEPEAAEPLWLTADQLAAWRGFIKLLRRLPAALEWQLQRDSQLSFTEYSVLAILSDLPGRRMRMSELAVMVDWKLGALGVPCWLASSPSSGWTIAGGLTLKRLQSRRVG
jgi:hypothetical protein